MIETSCSALLPPNTTATVFFIQQFSLIPGTRRRQGFLGSCAGRRAEHEQIFSRKLCDPKNPCRERVPDPSGVLIRPIVLHENHIAWQGQRPKRHKTRCHVFVPKDFSFKAYPLEPFCDERSHRIFDENHFLNPRPRYFTPNICMHFFHTRARLDKSGSHIEA